MITKEQMDRAIEYILTHLEEEISIEDVANHCHFSKFHFSRLFKEETGESLYAFIKRLKLEQSAIDLKLNRNRSVTEIGENYGYSPSNYSTAFKKHHEHSPAEFRRELEEAPGILHPFYSNERVSFQTFEDYDRWISIRELKDMTVLYERHLGNYLDLAKDWAAFLEKHREKKTVEALLIERFYDDPTITEVNQCIYDLCMTVDENAVGENIKPLNGGLFAIFHFQGDARDIFTSLQGVFRVWFPHSGLEMDERYGLNIYREMDLVKGWVSMDLCIPIKG